nr:sugar phosphate isomerase/epimerase family protein [Paenibacillus hamazuiensis]
MKRHTDEEPDSALKLKIRSMKVGFTGSFYPVPDGVDQEAAAEWQLRRAAELGCEVLQVRHLPKERSGLEELGRLAQSLAVELEMSVPGAFGLAGPFADPDAKAMFVQGMEQAKLLGMPVVRTAYGRLKAATSRFNRSMSVRDHLDALLPSLKEAARIAGDAGILLAVENHCDFTGRELAHLLDAVDSPLVGAALDTANGFTVFCDPNEDIEALAPYAFTTHMKDMVVVDSPVRGLIPFTAFGCPLGSGHVDIPRALQLLAGSSPHAEGLHLIIEPGWMRWEQDRDVKEQEAEFFRHGIEFLKALQHE